MIFTRISFYSYEAWNSVLILKISLPATQKTHGISITKTNR